jgi:hypothetical protein
MVASFMADLIHFVHTFARRDSSTVIRFCRHFDDRAEEGQVGLFGGYTTRLMRGKLDGTAFEQVGEVEYHFFIGTEEQWKSSQ